MSPHKVVILDGARVGEEHLAPLLAVLVDELKSREAEVRVFPLREIRLAHCIGCFGCWVETPGTCIMADEGRAIAGEIVRSNVTVLFTPVVFGGYSSELKKMVDRWIPLTLPYFEKTCGEIHHKPRYPQYPRLIGIGIQSEANAKEAAIFRAVVGRNALNFHAPSHAAEVLVADDPAIRERYRAVLSKNDALPVGEALQALMPQPEKSQSVNSSSADRRALLIVGSPKVKRPSTSAVLGNHLLERLKEQGWETESLTLRANLHAEKGQSELIAAVGRADLVLLAFPLYVDALPALVTKALEVLGSGRKAKASVRQRLAVVVNSGFPEARHNTLALAICREFAARRGFEWAGGLALGGGEALCSGQPLTSTDRGGRPPVHHIVQALDLTASALAEGQTVPAEAVALIAKNPIPFMPFSVWRWMFTFFGSRGWESQAAGHRVSKEAMVAKPYGG